MADQKLPWFKFSPDRWQSDEALGMCGAVARAVWIECICIMHKAAPYGHLVVNGLVPTVEQLARICRLPASDIEAGLAELEANRVFSRNKAGVVYSRCMTRAEKKARIARENGKMAGAATRCSETPIPASVPDTPPDKSLRDSEEKKDSGLRPVADATPGPSDPIPFDPAARLFGEVLRGLVVSSGRDERTHVRPLIAKLFRHVGAEEALRIAEQALAMRDPWSWFVQAVRVRMQPKGQGAARPPTNNDAAARDLLNAYHNPDFEYSIGVPSNG